MSLYGNVMYLLRKKAADMSTCNQIVLSAVVNENI